MSWFSKKLKKITNTLDPVGHQLRKATGGSYGDPLNFYQSHPNLPPGAKEIDRSLKSDPGMAGPTLKLGGSTGNYTYMNNPFQKQMAQVAALRGPGASPMGGGVVTPLNGGTGIPGMGGPKMGGDFRSGMPNMAIPGRKPNGFSGSYVRPGVGPNGPMGPPNMPMQPQMQRPGMLNPNQPIPRMIF